MQAQVEERFDDGDFTNSPSWQGSIADFNVNTEFQLQLNATSAGNSFLSVPCNLSTLDSIEWHLFIRLAFAPSSSNNARVYLVSDQGDLTQPLNGYFLQFGEALSNDAVELFRQDGTITTSICRGSNSMIATSFSAGVKITRHSDGTWKMYVDYSGSNNYTLDAMGFDTTYNQGNYLGVICMYTVGNINNFYFDDFYAGQIIGDTVKPAINSAVAESNFILNIYFSEKIDTVTVNNIFNYEVNNNIGQPMNVLNDPGNPLKYSLIFSNSFQPGTIYNFHCAGIKDLSQNIINDTNISFTYTPLLSATLNDVIISEIYFEPSLTSPLPDAEYIEIFNRRDSAISIDGWKISDGNTDGIISAFQLQPHGYALLFSENDSDNFENISNSVSVHSFPTLNNDVGDHLTIKNVFDETITELNFDNSHYNDDQKNDGGWSIERIDLNFTCDNVLNWNAAISNEHGTPGFVNSVNGNFVDETPPFVKNVFLTDNFNVTVSFSENISDGIGDLNNYLISDNGGNYLYASAVTIINNTEVQLNFSNTFFPGIYFLEINSSMKDCPGNIISNTRVLKFGLPENANANDVVINELLFHSFDGGNDFVEIYNKSQKIINLKDWIISENDYDDPTKIKDQSLITNEHRLLFPGEYLVLSEEDWKIKSQYNCNDPNSFLNVNGMPDYNSDKGIVIVQNQNGELIDEFRYSEDLHFPLLAETKGISLERLSFFQNSNDNNNWHSAAATAGFATPGYENSQRLDTIVSTDEIAIGGDIFSPDNDGLNDLLEIHYQFPQSGTMLSLNVFDCNGHPVRKILNGETVSNEGTICWDGLKDNRTIAASGIYIIMAKSFDLDGRSKVAKKICFLTRRY